MRRPAPTSEDLAVLDPENLFRNRLDADRAAIARLRQAGDLGEVGRVVHRLAGAAGTFGYAEIGDIAIGIDDRLATSGEPVTAAEMRRLLQAIDDALQKPGRSV
jgi:HPt (histidine-containing phosphotransfer) domain-containing protein